VRRSEASVEEGRIEAGVMRGEYVDKKISI
jgi:hypothetical protein